MEINITAFVQDAEPMAFSASKHELGQDAGEITWRNAKHEASSAPLLHSDNELDEFRSWIKEFGGWSEDEIAAWDAVECNALLIQFISGTLRELGDLCHSDSDEYGIDWDEAERLADKRIIDGSIFKGTDNQIYFTMS